MAKEDQKEHQGMERKKVLAIKENLIILKKIIRNQLVSQITLNILEKKYLKSHQIVKMIKTQDFLKRRNLKVEVIDLKTLPSKNTVKKEPRSRL